MNEAIQVAIGGISLGAVYFLLGAGISLVFGQSKIVNFAHGQFVVIGGFVAWAATRAGVPLVLAILISVVVVAVLALVVERLLLQRTIQNPFTAFLVSLGLFLILEQAVISIWGAAPRQLSSPVSGSWSTGAIVIPKTVPVLVGVAVVIGVALALLVRRSGMGRMIRASAEDAYASRYCGVTVGLVRTVAFAGGSAVAGLAGALLALEYPIDSMAGESYLITGFVIALMGGLGSLSGAAVGGLVLALSETIGQAYGAGEWVSGIGIGLLIVVLIVRPNGLFTKFSSAMAETQTIGVARLQHLGKPRIRRPVTIAGLGALLLVLPLVGISAAILTDLQVAMIFGIVAYSVALLYRLTGLLSFGGGAFMGLGSFSCAVMVGTWKWNFWLTLVVSLIVCGVVGALSGLILSRTRGLYFLIITFALADGAALVEQNVSITGGSSGLTVTSNFGSIFGISFQSSRSIYYLSASVLGLVTLVIFLIARSSFGQRAQAIRENEQLATSLGVGPVAYISIAFALSSMVAGIGGVLYLYQDLAVTPALFTALATVGIPLMVILGGVLAPSGPLIGALVLTILPSVLNFSTTAETYVYGLVIILVMLFARDGLVPYLDDLSARVLTALRGRVVGRRATQILRTGANASRASAVVPGSVAAGSREQKP